MISSVRSDPRRNTKKMVAQNTTNKAVAQNTSRKLMHCELAPVEFARAVRRSMPEGQDLPAPIRIRPLSHLLKLSTLTSFNHTDRQLVAFSISTNVARQLHNSSKRGDPHVSRNLATLSIPTDVATQLLTLSGYNDRPQQTSGFCVLGMWIGCIRSHFCNAQ